MSTSGWLESVAWINLLLIVSQVVFKLAIVKVKKEQQFLPRFLTKYTICIWQFYQASSMLSSMLWSHYTINQLLLLPSFKPFWTITVVWSAITDCFYFSNSNYLWKRYEVWCCTVGSPKIGKYFKIGYGFLWVWELKY